MCQEPRPRRRPVSNGELAVRRSALVFAILVGTAGSALAQSTQPTTNPAVAEARAKLEHEAASLPTHRFESIDEVFLLKRDGNRLTLTAAPSNHLEEETRIFVPGFGGIVRFQPRGSGLPRPPGAD